MSAVRGSPGPRFAGYTTFRRRHRCETRGELVPEQDAAGQGIGVGVVFVGLVVSREENPEGGPRRKEVGNRGISFRLSLSSSVRFRRVVGNIAKTLLAVIPGHPMVTFVSRGS